MGGGTVACGRFGFDPSATAGDAVIDAPLDGDAVIDAPLDGDVVASGLVGHWTLDDGIGATALDRSGQGNHGTLVGNPAWIAGRIGGALALDGVDDAVTIGDPASGVLDFGTASFTYMVWVRPITHQGPFDMPWWKGGAQASESGYDLELGTGGWGACLSDGSSLACLDLGSSTVGTWEHLAIVVDRDSVPPAIRGYRDGALTSELDVTGFGAVSSNNSLRLSGNNVQYLLHGEIDDVRIYARAVSAAEIRTLSLP